eukprot:29325-Pelagococcus_subviridis.AAC.3
MISPRRFMKYSALRQTGTGMSWRVGAAADGTGGSIARALDRSARRLFQSGVESGRRRGRGRPSRSDAARSGVADDASRRGSRDRAPRGVPGEERSRAGGAPRPHGLARSRSDEATPDVGSVHFST